MATQVELAAMLVDAEAAYHKLMLGGTAKVFVDQNGERIEYNTMSSARLAAYIQNLKVQLGLVTPGPMMVIQ